MNNERVMIRRPQVGRDPVMKEAEVLSRQGENVRICVIGEKEVLTVQASELVPVKPGFGVPGYQRAGTVVQSFPTSSGALGNRLR